MLITLMIIILKDRLVRIIVCLFIFCLQADLTDPTTHPHVWVGGSVRTRAATTALIFESVRKRLSFTIRNA